MIDNQKKKVLLIDDDEIHLTTAELFLKDEYEICKAQSGQEALDCISNNAFIPNVILLDILMPDMDGWEAFKKIKRVEILKNIPIIFLTSVEEVAKQKMAFKIGVADYIVKPYNMTELKNKIKDVLKACDAKRTYTVCLE